MQYARMHYILRLPRAENGILPICARALHTTIPTTARTKKPRSAPSDKPPSQPAASTSASALPPQPATAAAAPVTQGSAAAPATPRHNYGSAVSPWTGRDLSHVLEAEDDESAALLTAQQDEVDAVALRERAHAVVPAVRFKRSGATSLLDADEDEIAELGGPLAVAANAGLMATIPDGVAPGHSGALRWDASDSDAEPDSSDDDEHEVVDLLTEQTGTPGDLAQSHVALPPGVSITPDQLAKVEAAVERQKYLRKFLPQGFDTWSQVVAANGDIKRPGKARKALKAVRQGILDARLNIAKETPTRDGKLPRYYKFGYGTARGGDGAAAAVAAPSPLSAGAAFSWGRQLTPQTTAAPATARSGGRPMSRRQHRVAQAVLDALSGLLAAPDIARKFPDLAPHGVPLDVTGVYVTADLHHAYVYWSPPAVTKPGNNSTFSAFRSATAVAAAATAEAAERDAAALHGGSGFMARVAASAAPGARSARATSKADRMDRRRRRENDLSDLSPAEAAVAQAAISALRAASPALGHRLQQELQLKRALSLRFFRQLPTDAAHTSDKTRVESDRSPSAARAAAATAPRAESAEALWGAAAPRRPTQATDAARRALDASLGQALAGLATSR